MPYSTRHCTRPADQLISRRIKCKREFLHSYFCIMTKEMHFCFGHMVSISVCSSLRFLDVLLIDLSWGQSYSEAWPSAGYLHLCKSLTNILMKIMKKHTGGNKTLEDNTPWQARGSGLPSARENGAVSSLSSRGGYLETRHQAAGRDADVQVTSGALPPTGHVTEWANEWPRVNGSCRRWEKGGEGNLHRDAWTKINLKREIRKIDQGTSFKGLVSMFLKRPLNLP